MYIYIDSIASHHSDSVSLREHASIARIVGMLLSLHKDFLTTFTSLFICLLRDTFCIVFFCSFFARVI